MANNPQYPDMDILNVEQSSDKELVEELTKYRKEMFDKALRAAVTGVTPPEDFNGGKIPIREMRGGEKKAPYIPGWWFIMMANALFHHMWSSEVDEYHVSDKTDMIWVQGSVTAHIPGRTTITTHTDGRVVEERFDPINIKHSQFGSSAMKRTKDKSKFIDLGDDLKSAATDMKKKCLTNFGFGADIYGKREDSDSITASKNIVIVYKRAENRGMSISQVGTLCEDEVKGMGKPLTDLTEKELLDFLDIVDKAEVQ